MVAVGGLACGGDSPLEVPTPTQAATEVSQQPTQAPAVSPTVAAAPEATQAVGGQQQYTVQDGDTLGSIAAEFDVTVDAIVQANEITDPNFILPGETLVIPAASE